MPEREYTSLAEFGLQLVSSDDDRFRALVRDIEERPQPFPSWPIDDLRSAAVLLNESERAIVVLAYVWRYILANGTSRSSRYANLGSSMQMEILNGRSPVPQDVGTCILAGSKRLITERGMFGNNLDVLPTDQVNQGGSYVGAGGGGAAATKNNEQIVSIQLALDLAIFDNGLCVGPDKAGLLDALIESLDVQRTTSEHAAAAIRNGASEGQVFEMLLPSVRRMRSASAERHERVMLPMFGRMAIDQLINGSRPEQLEWFERLAKPSTLQLRRPM